MITHRQSNTKLYRLFYSMKGRCYNPKSRSFKNYGGRGISISSEWLDDCTKFMKWATDTGYKEGVEIDRIDVNGNYCAENCRWVTRIDNSRNTTKNVLVSYIGRTMCLSEWCQSLNLNYSTIYNRIVNRKWTPEKAFQKPAGFFLITKNVKSRTKRKMVRDAYCRQHTYKPIRIVRVPYP